MNYYQHHIGDYAAATAYLSLVEDAIYTRLLRVYYRDERPLPVDTDVVAWLVGLRTRKEKALLENLLPQFFQLQDDGWHCRRADEEISRYHDKQEKAKAAIDARWGKAKEQAPADTPAAPRGDEPDTDVSQASYDRNTDELPTNNQQPLTNITTTTPPLPPRKRGASFDAAQIALPDWLDPNDWRAWIAERKARKKPVTQEAAKRQIQQLDAYRREGHEPSAVITHSIAGGYQGLFPPRPAARASPNGQPAPQTRAQHLHEWGQRFDAMLARNLGDAAPPNPHDEPHFALLPALPPMPVADLEFNHVAH